MFRLLAATALALTLATPAVAQGPLKGEQKKHWFYLQKLAEDAATIFVCISDYSLSIPRWIESKADDDAWKAYYAITDELGAETESYISTYMETRGEKETSNSFRFRVWQVVSNAYGQQVEAYNPQVGMCSAMGVRRTLD